MVHRRRATAPMAPGRCWPACTPASIDPRTKIQAAVAPKGHFTKDQFRIDLAAGTVTCPTRHCPDPLQPQSTTPPPRPGQLRPGLHHLPAWRPVHQRGGWPHRHHHRLRARAGHCPRPPGRPGPRRRLPLNPAQGGAQACPSGPPPPRRPPRSGPRPCQGRRRLQPAGRRGQPGPAGRARPALDPVRWLGSSMSRPA